MTTWIMLLAIIAATCTGAFAAGDSAVKSVMLRVINHADVPLRCTAIIAHFLTDHLGSIQPGETLTVALVRHEPAGGLALGSFRDEPMWIENISCGADGNWTATATDVPLQQLRVTNEPQLSVFCSLHGRLECRPMQH